MVSRSFLQTFRAPRRCKVCADLSPRRSSIHHRGVGLIEVLVVIGILALLLSVLIPVVGKARNAQRNIQCINTLKNIGSAMHAYALEHQGKFPDPGLTDESWEQIIAGHFAGPFSCPSDSELAPAIGSSYDWRDTGKESTTLAGKSLADVRRSDAVLAMESLPGWHAKGMINVVRLDGAAISMDQQECFKDLVKPVRSGS